MAQSGNVLKPRIYGNMPAVFLRKDGRFEIKLQVTGGMLTAEQVKRAGEVAARYGSEVHLTVRQELSILGVAEDNLEKALSELKEVGLVPGSAGMVFRNVVSCLGSNYCFKAAAETTDLAREIGRRFSGEKTPGPLKVGIGGCPFPCTRPQFNEIGLMGRVRPEIVLDKCTGCGKCVEVCKVGATRIVDGKAVIDYDKCVMCGRCVAACQQAAKYSAENGFILFVGGRGSWPPHEGWVLCDMVPEGAVMPLLEKIVQVYREGAKPGMRMREFISSIGFEEFKKRVLG
ncbi:MAG TPA: 4Fe-4S binding protein [Methanothrix sp.]|nr:4Fe-4S binding protein [Methanothrix sp.]